MYYDKFFPFYMTYANPSLYSGERIQEQEFALMKSYYPETARRIQEKVEEECQLLDYEGSRMYDEYPDRVSMLLMCDRIAEELRREDAEAQAAEAAQDMADGVMDESMQAMHMDRPGPPPPPPFDPGRRSLLEVLLYNEMYKRRCKRRQCRRFW